MERARAGVIGALMLVVMNLIFDIISFPTYAEFGFKFLSIQNPLYYFVTTTIISFAIGIAFAILYLIIRAHIQPKGLYKGLVYGVLVWALTDCVMASKLIAYTTLPVVYSVIWLLEGLISYMIYGMTLSFTLEPHAHKWKHPELLEFLEGRKTRKTKKRTRRKRRS